MNRKKFIQKSLLGMGSIVALPAFTTSCSKEETGTPATDGSDTDGCVISPRETAGPFPIKTPSQLVQENIISDRTGVALLITITVQDQSDDCQPLAGVLVDVWHCDKDGNYSQYDNFANANFLRGRQTTDANGQASFISIFPGWYSGRAPHIHIEILDANANSLLVSQIAFPESTYTAVYNSTGYNGAPDTSNTQDNIFADSLSENLADALSGNLTDGYTLLKTIVV